MRGWKIFLITIFVQWKIKTSFNENRLTIIKKEETLYFTLDSRAILLNTGIFVKVADDGKKSDVKGSLFGLRYENSIYFLSVFIKFVKKKTRTKLNPSGESTVSYIYYRIGKISPRKISIKSQNIFGRK